MTSNSIYSESAERLLVIARKSWQKLHHEKIGVNLGNFKSAVTDGHCLLLLEEKAPLTDFSEKIAGGVPAWDSIPYIYVFTNFSTLASELEKAGPIPVLSRCPKCGTESGNEECETCNGSGSCSHCNHTCDDCGGSGVDRCLNHQVEKTIDWFPSNGNQDKSGIARVKGVGGKLVEFSAAAVLHILEPLLRLGQGAVEVRVRSPREPVAFHGPGWVFYVMPRANWEADPIERPILFDKENFV